MKLNHMNTNLEELSLAEKKEIGGGESDLTYATYALGYLLGLGVDTFIDRLRAILTGTDSPPGRAPQP